MTVLLTLIALVLAYVVGQIHLMHIIQTKCPAAWLMLQAWHAGFECSVKDQEEQKEEHP